MRTYTTAEAAHKAGVSRQTLHAWITRGLVAAPRPVKVGHRTFRFWTQKDVQRLKQFKGRLRPGPGKEKMR